MNDPRLFSEDPTRCPTCDAKVVRYTHNLNRNLLVALHRLYAHAGRAPVNLKHVGLTRNQWDNFQKLRYWNLAQRSAKAGEWFVTLAGKSFLIDGASVPRQVQTYRGDLVASGDEQVTATDVLSAYRYDRIDWYVSTQEPVG